MSAAKAHPSLGDPGDLVEYYPQAPLPGPVAALVEPIKVRVPAADIPTIFAHRQWRAGMLLADLVYANALPLENRNVLELGAGTGLPSIAACQWGKAKHVVVTDYDSPSLITTLRANVQANTPHRSPITVLGHTWATAIDDMHDTIPDGRFDVILLADCIWDSLSHAALLKSITSLLRRDGKARVYMVSGLHTGRAKIVSFLRRAHRLGLLLTDFPPPSPGQQWPLLTQAEGEVQAQETAAYAHDDALARAPTQVLEMQVLTDKSEEAVVHADTRIWQAKTTRLNGMRRAFVVEEREEEKKENNGVHVRNTWITFAALAWQT